MECSNTSQAVTVQIGKIWQVNLAFAIWIHPTRIEFVHDAVGEPGFHNRYSYAGGNPVNRVDRNGMCWTNASASPSQQDQCRAAWNGYTEIVTDTYTSNWPRDIRILMTQEAQYWSNLSYTEFTNQWNSSRPPSQTDSRLGQGAQIALGAGLIGGLTPDDLIWLTGAVCLYGAAAVVGSNTAPLPLRPSWNFSVNFDWQALERAAIATLTMGLTAGTPKILYRGTALGRAYSRSGLEAGKLWLADNVAYATIYAHFDAQLERDTSAISIYGILQGALAALIVSGNVEIRFQVEYGFDPVAQSALVGPVVIPIPDYFKG